MMNRLPGVLRQTDWRSGLAVLLLLCAAGGCTTKPKPKLLFYPPPPDQPRLQYLTGFSSAKEFFGQSGFKKFVLGKSAKDRIVGKPYGITARTNQIFFCDSGFSGVGILKLDKGVMDRLIPEREPKMKTPINVDSDAQGNLYVTDTEREQVLIYGPDGTPLEPIGRKDEFKPCGLAVSGEELFVTDLKHHQVRVYRLSDHTVLRTIPAPGSDAKGKLYSPTNVAVDRQGKVYVADPGAFCVQVFDREGKYLRTLGRQGVGPGLFARPRGLAVDHEGRVYIVDAATQVVQLFDSEGRLLIFFGDPNTTGPGATSLPAGVAVDYDNVAYFEKFVAPGHKLEYVVLLTNQYGDPRISVYGFLKQP
jgi:DNA-binding beta-propeller fold protein YncE